MIVFEVVDDNMKKYDEVETRLPSCGSVNSAGYDFYSPIDIVIKPNTSELIWSNIKCKYDSNIALIICVRSSMGKSHICLANDIGLIDADYYSNCNNDGNIGFRLLNLSNVDYVIKRGDKIGQGFFVNYLRADNIEISNNLRTGGFGSTDNK